MSLLSGDDPTHIHRGRTDLELPGFFTSVSTREPELKCIRITTVVRHSPCIFDGHASQPGQRLVNDGWVSQITFRDLNDDLVGVIVAPEMKRP